MAFSETNTRSVPYIKLPTKKVRAEYQTMTAMDEYERAQTQAMELLIEQCVPAHDNALSAPSRAASKRDNAAVNATLLDLFAQTCADANAAIQELSVEEVATGLARAVCATQESLRSVGQNVSAILDDPEQIRELCDHVKPADTKVFEALQEPSALLEAAPQYQNDGSKNDGIVQESRDATGSVLIVPPNEENVRNMMVFAAGMCTTMDHALSTITKDELALTAQLSLNIAQKLLDAGQSLFTSLGNDERRKMRAADRGDRIMIEELEGNEQEGKGLGRDGRVNGRNSSQLKRAAVMRTYVTDLYNRTREEAVEHPFLAGALVAAGLPFIGLVVRLLLLFCDAVLVIEGSHISALCRRLL